MYTESIWVFLWYLNALKIRRIYWVFKYVRQVYNTDDEWVSSFLTAHQHIIGHSVP